MLIIQKIKFGDIWIANLNPNSDTEPGKTRPVLIMQNQQLLDENHPSTLVIPLTTNLVDGAEPLRIRLSAQDNLKQDSDLLIDQLSAIDNKRLVQGPLTSLNSSQMLHVQEAFFELIDYWKD